MCCEFIGSGFSSLKTSLMDVIKSDGQGGIAEPPRGLAVKSGSVYVARRWSPEIEIYRISNSKVDVSTRKTYTLAGCQRPDDLVASCTDNVIYILAWVASNEQVVLTVSCDTGKVLASWPVVKMPHRLSVYSGNNTVLAACQDGLRTYSSSGLLNYIIPIKVNAGPLWHAVQIPTHSSCSDISRFDHFYAHLLTGLTRFLGSTPEH